MGSSSRYGLVNESVLSGSPRTILEEHMIFCASRQIREDMLRRKSSALKVYSESVRLRLYSPEDNPQVVPATSLNVPEIQSALLTRALGQVMVYAEETSSTQDMLRSHFRGLPEGSVAVAFTQSSGRGRRGSEWETPSGSLAFSMRFALPMSAPERLTFMQYIAALAVVEALKGRPEWADIPVRIKWPNDLYMDGKKVGGVLCEASTQGRGFDVIVGVGINISNRFPSACLNDALRGDSELGQTRPDMSKAEFLVAYLNAMERLFDEFVSTTGFRTMEGRYISSWLHTDQVVRLEANDNSLAKIVGLAPNGYVRVSRLDTNEVLDIAPDVSSLDILSGVIREKAHGPV